MIDPIAIENPSARQLGPSQAPTITLPNPLPQPAQEAGTAVRPSGDQVQLSGSRDSKFEELQQRNARSNSAAGAIRHADRSLETLGQKIDALKEPLGAIVKNFPPFSPQDQARVKLLKNYASLRKEIDQLTLPAPPEVVKARKAQTLPEPLPMDANDSQIADHLAKLDATGAALSGTRAGLAADAAALLHDGRFSSIFSGPNGVQTGVSDLNLTESSARQKSTQVGRLFAAVVSQGVTANSSQFLKGLS
jgi:hypothetical protein